MKEVVDRPTELHYSFLLSELLYLLSFWNLRQYNIRFCWQNNNSHPVKLFTILLKHFQR